MHAHTAKSIIVLSRQMAHNLTLGSELLETLLIRVTSNICGTYQFLINILHKDINIFLQSSFSSMIHGTQTQASQKFWPVPSGTVWFKIHGKCSAMMLCSHHLSDQLGCPNHINPPI